MSLGHELPWPCRRSLRAGRCLRWNTRYRCSTRPSIDRRLPDPEDRWRLEYPGHRQRLPDLEDRWPRWSQSHRDLRRRPCRPWDRWLQSHPHRPWGPLPLEHPLLLEGLELRRYLDPPCRPWDLACHRHLLDPELRLHPADRWVQSAPEDPEDLGGPSAPDRPGVREYRLRLHRRFPLALEDPQVLAAQCPPWLRLVPRDQ